MFLFFNLELVTRKQKNERLTTELVTWNNSKVKQKQFNYRVSNSKYFFLFFYFELVTRSVTLYFLTSSQ